MIQASPIQMTLLSHQRRIEYVPVSSPTSALRWLRHRLEQAEEPWQQILIDRYDGLLLLRPLSTTLYRAPQMSGLRSVMLTCGYDGEGPRTSVELLELLKLTEIIDGLEQAVLSCPRLVISQINTSPILRT